MIAKLEFNLEEPSDRTAHMRCARSLDMALAILDMCNGFRDTLNREDLNEVVRKTLEAVQTRFLATLEGYNLDIDELVE